MRISSIEYKLQIRDFLNRSLTIDFKIVIIIFPVLFGIYKVLYSKNYSSGSFFTHENNFSKLLQQTLPGISSKPTVISWQTFDQIFSEQLKFEQFSISRNENAFLKSLSKPLSTNEVTSSAGQVNSKAIFTNVNDKSENKNLRPPMEAQSAFCKAEDARRPPMEDFFNKKIFIKKNNENIKIANVLLENNSKTYINQIYFYNHFTIINCNTNWYKKQKKLYTGFFNNVFNIKKSSVPVQTAIKKSSVPVQTASSCSIKYHLGNNWSSVASKKLYSLSGICQTPDSLISNIPIKQNRYTKTNTVLNCEKRTQNSSIKSGNRSLSQFDTGYQNVTNSINKCKTLTNKNQGKFINYLNLDELPVKLNGLYAEKNSFFNYKLVSSNLIAKTAFGHYKLQLNIFPKKYLFNKLSIFEFTHSPKRTSYVALPPWLAKFCEATTHKLPVHFYKYILKYRVQVQAPGTKFFPRSYKNKTQNSLPESTTIRYRVFKLRIQSKKQVKGFPQCTQGAINYNLVLKGIKTFTTDNSDVNQKLIFFKNQKKTKCEYLENLLKKYTLNRNLTPLSYYSVLGKNFENIFTTYKQTLNLKNLSEAPISENIDFNLNSDSKSKEISSNNDFTRAEISKAAFFSKYSEISNPKKFLVWTSNLSNALQLLLVLEEFVLLDKNVEIAPRLMSGYTIPDNNNTCILFRLKKSQNLSKPNYIVGIDKYAIQVQSTKLRSDQIRSTIDSKILKNYVHTIEDLEPKQNILNFEFLSKPVNFSSFKQLLYNGSSVSQNKLTNELKINNTDQIKKVVKQFLYSDNPLTDRQKSFFGNSSVEEEQRNRTSITRPAQPWTEQVSSKIIQDTSNLSSIPDRFVADSEHDIINLQPRVDGRVGLTSSDLLKASMYRVPLFLKNKYEKLFTTTLYSKNKIRIVTPENKTLIKYLTICPPSEIFLRARSGYIIYLNQVEWSTFLKKFQTAKKLNIKNLFPVKPLYQPNKLPILWPLNQLDFKRKLNFSKPKLQAGLTQNVAHFGLNQRIVSSEQGSLSHRQSDQIQKTSSDYLLNSKRLTVRAYGNNVIGYVDQIQNTNVPEKKILTCCASNLLLLKKLMFKYYYLPYSQNLAEERLSTKFSFGQTYKKKYSTYKNKNLSFFYNINEPITNVPIHNKKLTRFTELFYQPREPSSYDSWLVVTQFSIGFFLIRIFQNILQKYEQEMKYMLSSLFENKDFNSGQPNTEQNSLHSQFRIIKNITKNFDNIAGINVILPELGEIIWFLRNSEHSFKTKKSIPQSILLTGPPGTGKTLLVQAIAGEAEIPVLIESASSLHQSGPVLNSSERLKNLFAKAQEIAPCIIFIDEIDTFGKARSGMMENPILTNIILDSIYPKNQRVLDVFTRASNFNLIPKPTNLINHEKTLDILGKQFSSHQSSDLLKNKINQEKSNLLMQFLIELDGVTSNKKVLVFGATNRPEILDSALTRPGRFNKTLHLKLPNKQKRIEIVKLYSDNIGIEKNISWDYIANLTIGLSAADLASAINQSSMQAIQAETIHTIKTIEYGIESVTGFSSQKTKLKSITQSVNLCSTFAGPTQQISFNLSPKQSFVNIQKFLFINRLAYYQAGKIVVHTLLKKHPAIISIRLWPELKTQRYHLILGIFAKKFSQMYRRVELESRIIGFYGGKAGEFINLFASLNQKTIKKNKFSTKMEMNIKNDLYIWQSDLGIQDISFASWLAELMINKWYLYSKKISLQNFNQLEKNYNTEDISNVGIIARSALCFAEGAKRPPMEDFLEKKSNYTETVMYQIKNPIKENSQSWVTKPWLQKQVTKKLEFSYSKKNDWYKIYGGDHQENENTQYLSAEKYFHNNTSLKNLNSYKFCYTGISFKKKISLCSIVNWNDISSLNRDYIYHNLILTCFNKAILIIDQNRELFDLFAVSLLQKETLREYEILKIIKIFYKNFCNLPSTSLAQ